MLRLLKLCRQDLLVRLEQTNCLPHFQLYWEWRPFPLARCSGQEALDPIILPVSVPLVRAVTCSTGGIPVATRRCLA